DIDSLRWREGGYGGDVRHIRDAALVEKLDEARASRGVKHMRMNTAGLALAVAAAVLTTSLVAQESFRTAPAASGAVYVMTNDPSRNAVLQFRRHANGQLTFEDHQSTGGRGGTGNGVGAVDPLGSQDALVLNGDGSRLIAVNAGSDTISVLGTTNKRLSLLSRVRSGGDFPNSVALWGDLVYVLNAHGT